MDISQFTKVVTVSNKYLSEAIFCLICLICRLKIITFRFKIKYFLITSVLFFLTKQIQLSISIFSYFKSRLLTVFKNILIFILAQYIFCHNKITLHIRLKYKQATCARYMSPAPKYILRYSKNTKIWTWGQRSGSYVGYDGKWHVILRWCPLMPISQA